MAGAVASMRFTVLTAKGKITLTKIHSPGQTIPYDRAKTFKAEVVDVTSMSAFLKKMEAMPQSCVIRGAPKSNIDLENAFRRLDSFVDQPLGWMMLDYDGPQRVDWPDLLTDPEGAVKMILPKELGDCHVWWQLGGSAGIKKGKYSLHLWIPLERELTSEEVRPFTKEHGFDAQLQHPIQIHYTASPIFRGGMVDPVPKRSGAIVGKGPAKTDEIILSYRAHKKQLELEKAKNFSDYSKTYEGPKASIGELMEFRFSDLINGRKGSAWTCDCPNHASESKKSLHVSPDRERWFCHGCNVGGKSAYSLALFLTRGDKRAAIFHLKQAK